MDHEMKYRVSNAQRTRKLRQYTNVADPEDLRAELGAARLLCQEAMDQGQIGVANALLAGIAKLSHSQIAAKRMRSEYLERATVLRVARELVRIVSKAVENKFPGWETTLEAVADEVTKAVAAATNEKPRQVETLPE